MSEVQRLSFLKERWEIVRIKELQKAIHQNAKKHGWWDNERNPLEIHMLIVSEVSEATEEVRNDKEPYYEKNRKPEGESVELADAVIRIMDYFEHKGWDLEDIIIKKHEYNKSRPYKHGGKKF